MEEPKDIGPFRKLYAENGALLVVGHMMHRNDSSEPDGIMICAADDPYDKCNQLNDISFRTDAEAVVLCIGEGRTVLHSDDNGVFRFQLRSCYGAMIKIVGK